MCKRIVSIAEFGAKPDSGLQTDAIQAAIDAVWQQGGGEVQIPSGRWRTGGIRLRSRVTLHLLENAVLEGSRDCGEYDICDRDVLEPIPDTKRYQAPRSHWNHGLIKAVDAEEIAILGEKGSRFDGRDCYDPAGEEGYRGPHGINLYYCKNITLRGYTFENSGNWAHCIYCSSNIDARKLTVLGGHDGFHCRGCTNILVEDCVFHTGDDCVAGCADINVTVRNCEMNTSCSDFRFGGTNVLIEHCKAWGPGIYGHRYTMSREEQAASAPTNETHRHDTLGFFTYLAEETLRTDCLPGNIVIRDCTVDTADRFYQFNFSGSDKWQVGQPVKSIRFENMKVRNIAMPIVAYSTEDVQTIVEFRDFDYTVAPGFEKIDVIQTANFERLSFHNAAFHNVKAGHLIRSWSAGGILETENLTVDDTPDQLLVMADAPFSSADV